MLLCAYFFGNRPSRNSTTTSDMLTPSMAHDAFTRRCSSSGSSTFRRMVLPVLPLTNSSTVGFGLSVGRCPHPFFSGVFAILTPHQGFNFSSKLVNLGRRRAVRLRLEGRQPEPRRLRVLSAVADDRLHQQPH